MNLSTTSTPENDANDVVLPPETCDISMGDHVFQWCSLGGIPQVFQHHAICIDIQWRPNLEGEYEWIAKIADFSNEITHSSPLMNKTGCVRFYECPAKRWKRVEYDASFWKRHTWRAGTCTAVQSDAPGLVRARAQFLLEHPEVLPAYDAVRSNCECVAVWCKTGTWATLQAASWLSVATAGQVKSAVTIAGAAASAQITVPAAGMWGWLGFTTHVSLLAAQPLLLPAIVAYGVVTAGAPAVMLASAKRKWTKITETLNTTFWEQAVDNPEVFVDCITYWSARHEPEVLGQDKELISDERVTTLGGQCVNEPDETKINSRSLDEEPTLLDEQQLASNDYLNSLSPSNSSNEEEITSQEDMATEMEKKHQNTVVGASDRQKQCASELPQES